MKNLLGPWEFTLESIHDATTYPESFFSRLDE